jgi:renalase
MKEYIIIGAGMSGLNLAYKLKESGLSDVLILEKSRGVGGRVATRRTLNTKFDHGAQFYRLKSEVTEYHKKWIENEIVKPWFVSIRGDHWNSNEGLTAITKNMANGLEIQLEKQIKSIEYCNEKWTLKSSNEEIWQCKNLIITAPLVQAMQLIQNSNLEVDEKLNKIQYTKALISLITLEEDFVLNPEGYEEYSNDVFFSISDQKRKGVSQIPALTVTMSPSFSEIYFDKDDHESLNQMNSLLNEKFPTLKINKSELKKWRYCQALKTYSDLFYKHPDNLFLIGDAFGGNSIMGALRSSNALFEYFLNLN